MNTGDPELDAWPNCSTPDCSNKVCTWGSEDRCFPCEARRVGRDEMIRRYNSTHDHTFEEAQSEER